MKPVTRHLVHYLLAPVLFLTVALMAGIRFQIGTNSFQFVYPPLVSCIVGALAMILLVRCGIAGGAEPDGEDRGALESAVRVALITTVYFATVQVFSLVTPERGLLSFFFNVFYLLILLNDLFVVFNPRRLAGALAVILGASFMLKFLVMADLFAPASSWGKYILQGLLKTGSLGALDQEPFAPATGYLAFFTVALYLVGLYLIAPQVTKAEALLYRIVASRYGLTSAERVRLGMAVASLERGSDVGEAAVYPSTALARTNARDSREFSLPVD